MKVIITFECCYVRTNTTVSRSSRVFDGQLALLLRKLPHAIQFAAQTLNDQAQPS
jgi:hypothetical protein